MKVRVKRMNLNSPRTVDEAVDRLIAELPLKDKAILANMTEEELDQPHFTIGNYIRNNFGLWTGNESLMESCRAVSENDDLHVDSASIIIIEELWKKLRKTHKLRIVK
ncbi:MAG: hypothetical protein Q8P24_04795 [Desulfobacterales bacterium]|nr:hypothetical protein [Desulfobacterales bacterium]